MILRSSQHVKTPQNFDSLGVRIPSRVMGTLARLPTAPGCGTLSLAGEPGRGRWAPALEGPASKLGIVTAPTA